VGKLEVPTDNGHPGTFRIELYPDQAELVDGIVLNADRPSFLALAEVFRQMADSVRQEPIFIWAIHMTPSQVPAGS